MGWVGTVWHPSPQFYNSKTVLKYKVDFQKASCQHVAVVPVILGFSRQIACKIEEVICLKKYIKKEWLKSFQIWWEKKSKRTIEQPRIYRFREVSELQIG